jgi:protein-tyrosine phosphatase
VVPNRRVGIYYTAGACVALLVGVVLRPWGLLLIWPAISLTIVASSYFGLGPCVFRKTEGKIPRSAWVILWPVLLGQHISLIYYSRRCRPWDRLTPYLWIGRKLTVHQARRAIAEGVTAVLDLTGEFSEVPPLLGVTYRQLPIMDLTAPTPGQTKEAIEFIREHSAPGIVYVHCKVGYSRSAAIAGAFLLASGQSDDAQAAVEMLRAARPSIVIRPEALDAIQSFESDHT